MAGGHLSGLSDQVLTITSKSKPSVLMNKYQNISDLLDKSDLFVRRIYGITGHSINTVRKTKQLKEI